MRHSLLSLGLLSAVLAGCTQAPLVQHLEHQPSLRGLSAVDSRHAWISGSQATVAKTSDGGRSWTQLTLPEGAPDTLDFRDIEALTAAEVILMSAGPGGESRIFRTSDGGQSWEFGPVNDHPDGFWDGIAFWDQNRGLLVGDPIDGSLTVLRTTDGGRSWDSVPAAGLPPAIEGEYAFAASGTSVAVHGEDLAWLATGGSVARVLRSEDGGDTWKVHPTPMSTGTAGSGIFSIAFRDANHGVIVGGDYEHPDQVLCIAAWTEDGGRTWHPAEVMPGGYRSGASWDARSGRWIAVGTNGVDTSRDGKHWKPLQAPLPWFHSVDGAWMSGAKGSVGRLR